MMIALRNQSSRNRGHVLMATLVVAAVIGIALAAFLNLLTSQNSYTVRSQVWNACMPVVEAGLEEAMAHLNDTTDTNLNDNGWSWDSDAQAFTKQRWIGTSYYKASIATNSGTPVISSTGFIPAPVTVGYGSVVAQIGVGTVTNYIARTVQIGTHHDPLFNHAMLAKLNIDFSGNNCASDSYNSALGPYLLQTPGDKGDIATDWGAPGAINANNANIKGHLATGPGSTLKVGPNSSIGSAGWVSVPTPGIESGWWRTDLNEEIPDVLAPWTGATLPPGPNGLITYWLDKGNYELPGDLTLGPGATMFVNSNATLWVKGNIKMNGGNITIANTGSLRLYISGNKADFSGTLIKPIAPATLQIFGLPTCVTVNISTGSKLEAVIDTPAADVVMNGTAELYGSAVVRSIKFTGSSFFHYDESLANLGIFRPYAISTWQEL